MLKIETLSSLREHIRLIHQENKRIALVPTMGNLHNGHVRLIDEAKLHSDVVIVSIFVNPMQFDCIEDLQRYPCTLQKDYEKLSERCVDFVFTPKLEDMYPKEIKEMTYVHVPSISTTIEGNNRPGHFRGVSTIVSKLFNLIQPNVAFFGEKDYQQLILIRRMVMDMGYDIDIISIPIVRDKDGLALSSRNGYLNPEQRKIAPYLSRIINKIEMMFLHMNFSLKEIISFADQKLNEKGFTANDVQIRDADTLSELTDRSNRAVILVSACLGKTRLIDNKIIKLRS